MSTVQLPPAVLETVATTEVTQLVLTERESRDLGHWQTMRSCFHPDSRIRVSWFDGDGEGFVKGSIEMARRGVLATHRLGPVRVRLHGERAIATLSAIIDIPTSVGNVEAVLSSHARFLFRAERRNQRWGLTGFDAIYRRDEGEDRPDTVATIEREVNGWAGVAR